MTTKLQKAQAAMAARRTSFPVLVLDGSMADYPANFSATIYGNNFEPLSPETTKMSSEEIKAGQHFLLRMRSRAEWEAEVAKAKG